MAKISKSNDAGVYHSRVRAAAALSVLLPDESVSRASVEEKAVRNSEAGLLERPQRHERTGERRTQSHYPHLRANEVQLAHDGLPIEAPQKHHPEE